MAGDRYVSSRRALLKGLTAMPAANIYSGAAAGDWRGNDGDQFRLLPHAFITALDPKGNIVPGGRLYFHQAGRLPRDAATDPSAGIIDTGLFDIAFLQAGARAVASTVQRKLRALEVSVFDYMTPSQIEAVHAYDYATDVTEAVQSAVSYAYRNTMRLKFPPGGYLVSQLRLPDTIGTDFRGYPFEMVGTGRGEAFVINDTYKRGTVIRGSNPTLSTLLIQQRNENEGTGCLNIHGIRFEGHQNAGVPVALIEALYGASKLHDCDFYQSGEGDGVYIGFMATGSLEHCYILNRDWLAPRGTVRVGTGLIYRNDINCGLAAFRKITSRGWDQAYDIGNTSGSVIHFSPLLEHCECSVVNNGVRLRERVWKGVVDRCYFEGVEGTCVLNEGNYNTIRDGSFGEGFAVGIDDSSADNIGTIIDGNCLQVAERTPCTLIRVTSSGAHGGPGKTVSNNNMTWSYSGRKRRDVIAVEVAGIDPRINLTGNSFSPRGPWVGTSNVYKIKDRSTASDGTHGSGIFGLSMASSGDGSVEVPLLARGAVSLAVEEQVLTQADVSSNALTLSPLSVMTLVPAVPVVVSRFLSPNLPGKRFGIHLSNGNTRLKQGQYLKLAGSVDFSPGPAGAWIEFQIKPGGVAWEVSRTIY